MPVSEPPQAMVNADDPTDVIEVVATRDHDTVKIDRRTFNVLDTPHSAQKNAVQLLRGLPAVTVTSDDRILILGAGVSKIYIDGRPYLGDPSLYLRTLNGSDIERIEVITNPSAQFSSEGAGGAINLVLRKNRTEGITGNASFQESTYGHGLVDTTLNFKRGDWAYQIKGGGNIGTMARQRYHERRSITSSDSGNTTINREDGLFTYDGTVGRLTGKATYNLDSKTSFSAQLGGGGGNDILTDKIDYSAVTSDFRPFSEHRRVSSVASYVTGELSVEHRGSKAGESLNATVQFYKNPTVRDITNARFSDGRNYRLDLQKPTNSVDGQVDWKRPIDDGEILSLGSSWHVDRSSQRYSFSSNDVGGSFGPDTEDQFDGRSSTLSAYASFQLTLGTITFAPGLRGEANWRRISGNGSEEVRIQRNSLFPSLHGSYKVSKELQFGLSYSKRIDRAPLDYLRPYGVVEDAYTVFEGNPRLKDQSTNAYELSVQLHRGKIEANATLYLRETSKLWSKSFTTNTSGVSAYSYVNSGTRWNSGAQFDLSVPVSSNVKALASVNVFDQRSPIDAGEGPVSQRVFRYSTNGTLEWTGRDREGAPGDVAQFQWSYSSPSRDYQIREKSTFDLTASFTHSFDRTLSLSGTFRYLGRTRRTLDAPFLQEYSSRQRTPEFQLKLQKTL